MHAYLNPQLKYIDLRETTLEESLPTLLPEANLSLSGTGEFQYGVDDQWLVSGVYPGEELENYFNVTEPEDYIDAYLLHDSLGFQETRDRLLYVQTEFIDALPVMERAFYGLLDQMLRLFGGVVSLDDKQTWLSGEEFHQQFKSLLELDLADSLEQTQRYIDSGKKLESEWEAEPDHEFDLTEEVEDQLLPKPTI